MRKLLFILALCMSILLVGCGKSNGTAGLDKPQVPNMAKSANVTADIYLDGTSSMYGYVNYPQATVYADAIRGIEQTITETWKNDKVEYVKFGDGLQKLSRAEFLKMNTVGFYDQKDTSLQNVISKTDGNKLNILVTDLFQTNQDLDSIVLALKDKLSNGSALAIIGMKSQFNGKIFDIGKNLSSLDYASTNDSSTYRPFYLLVFGPENNVRAFVTAYKTKFADKGHMKIAFISPNLGIDDKLTADKGNNKKKDKKAVRLAQISTILPHSDILQYRLKTGEKLSEDNIKLVSSNVFEDVPKVYNVVVDKIEVGTAQNNGQETQKKQGFFSKLFGNSKKGITYKFEKISADNFFVGKINSFAVNNAKASASITFQVIPVAIQKKAGIYRVQFSLVPTKPEYLKSLNVFKDWNFDDSQVAGNLKQIGTRTLNISKFINILGNINYELNHPGFHYNYIYFDAVK